VAVVVVVVEVDVLVVVGVWAVVGGGATAPLPQFCLASSRTAAVPCERSDTSVGSIDPGRFATWVWSLSIAFAALTQLLLDRSALMRWSSEFSEVAWLVESRPEPAPQAASNAVASPSPPARRARET